MYAGYIDSFSLGFTLILMSLGGSRNSVLIGRLGRNTVEVFRLIEEFIGVVFEFDEEEEENQEEFEEVEV